MPYFGAAIGKIIGKVAGTVKTPEKVDEHQSANGRNVGNLDYGLERQASSRKKKKGKDGAMDKPMEASGQRRSTEKVYGSGRRKTEVVEKSKPEREEEETAKKKQQISRKSRVERKKGLSRGAANEMENAADTSHNDLASSPKAHEKISKSSDSPNALEEASPKTSILKGKKSPTSTLRVVLDPTVVSRCSPTTASNKGKLAEKDKENLDNHNVSVGSEGEGDTSPDIFLGKGRRSRPRKYKPKTANGKPATSAEAINPVDGVDAQNDSIDKIINDNGSEPETEDYTNYNGEDDDFEPFSRKSNKVNFAKSKKSVATVQPTMASTSGAG